MQMLTLESFISEYEQYSDEELYNVYVNRNDYSEQAQRAIDVVIINKGGLEVITSRLKQKQIIVNERERIKLETTQLAVNGTNILFLKKLITSYILNPKEVNEIIEQRFAQISLEQEDKKIKPQTIFGSVIGGGIASIIGGILWGLQMIQMQRVFYILIFGLAILSYGLIKFITGQSRNNKAVLVATIISVISALIIGQLIFETFG